MDGDNVTGGLPLQFSKLDAARVLAGALRRGTLPSIFAFLSKYKSLHDTKPLKATLRRALSGYYNSFAQSPTYFALSVTNLNNSRREYFYKVPVGSKLPDKARQRPDVLWEPIDGLELLLDALIGSTALPILFPPNGPYFDGGVLLNQPISPAILRREPDVLYVVIPSAKSLGRTDNIIEIGQTVLSTWTSASLISQLDRLRLVNRMRADRRDTDGKDERLPICVIRPPEDLTVRYGVNLLSFGLKVRQLVADGKSAADEKLNRFDIAEEATWYDI